MRLGRHGTAFRRPGEVTNEARQTGVPPSCADKEIASPEQDHARLGTHRHMQPSRTGDGLARHRRLPGPSGEVFWLTRRSRHRASEEAEPIDAAVGNHVEAHMTDDPEVNHIALESMNLVHGEFLFPEKVAPVEG